KGSQRMFAVAETGEDQIEPHHVRFKITERAQQAAMIAEAVLNPAALHAELAKLRRRCRQVIGQHGEAHQGIRLQLSGYVVAILAYYGLAGRESADKANLHGTRSTLKDRNFDHWPESGSSCVSGEVVEILLLEAKGKTQRIIHSQRSVPIMNAAAQRP